MKNRSSIVTVAMAAISSFLLSSPALADFDLWEITEVYSNADGTVQYIELFTEFNGQQFTFDATIRTSQGADFHGFNFVVTTPAPTGGHHLLLATPDFATLPGSVTPDFIITPQFLFTPDGIVDFIGANRLSYDCLPSDGILSLHCDANDGIICTATSIGANSPTNYAGQVGSIDAGDGGCTDFDSDGFGSPGSAACPGGAEQDCDDCDATAFPGAPETTCDSIDNDCDPTTLDDPDDNDNDGVGACTDCDDADPDRFPGNPEVLCNGIDEDCDPGTLDDPNADGDAVSLCNGDCDDGNAGVFPGNVETTCNGLDDDCDPGTEDDPDNDNDGVGVCTDCDDGDPNRFPGNPEVFCNGLDEDCDPGTVDDPNADGDAFSVCSGDCDDGNAAVFPGAVETTCNGLDDDCDPGTLDDPDNDCIFPLPADPPNDQLNNRYISFKPNNGGELVKLKVTLTASVPHPGLLGSSWWVQAPFAPGNPLLGPGECVALLGAEAPAAQIDWDAAGCQTLHVTGCPVEPTSDYEVRAVVGMNVSDPLPVSTILKPGVKWWGDTVGFFNGTEWTPPNNNTNIDDAVAGIKTFQGGPVVPPGLIPPGNVAHLSVADVDPGDINTVVNINDVFLVILGFQGEEYPFGPADADGNCP